MGNKYRALDKKAIEEYKEDRINEIPYYEEFMYYLEDNYPELSEKIEDEMTEFFIQEWKDEQDFIHDRNHRFKSR